MAADGTDADDTDAAVDVKLELRKYISRKEIEVGNSVFLYFKVKS